MSLSHTSQMLRLPVNVLFVGFQIETENEDPEHERGWILDNSSGSQLITIEEIHGAIAPEVIFCLKDNHEEGQKEIYSHVCLTTTEPSDGCLGHSVHQVVIVTYC